MTKWSWISLVSLVITLVSTGARGAELRDTTLVLASGQELYWLGQRLTSPVRLVLSDSSLTANGHRLVTPNEKEREAALNARAARIPISRKFSTRTTDPRAIRDSTERAMVSAIHDLLVAARASGLSGGQLSAYLATVADTDIVDTKTPIVVRGDHISGAWKGAGSFNFLNDPLPTARTPTLRAQSVPTPGATERTTYYYVIEALSSKRPVLLFVHRGSLASIEGPSPVYDGARQELRTLELNPNAETRFVPLTTVECIRRRAVGGR